MGILLFDPRGRIVKRRFWQGLVVLTVAAILLRGIDIHLAPMLEPVSGPVIFVAGLALLYAEICVYAKRFHDAGTSGWWIIAVWVAKFFVFLLLFMFLGGLFIGDDGRAILTELMERLDEPEVVEEGIAQLVVMLFPFFVFTIVANAVLAAFIIGSLPTEPRTNKHGPVPGSRHDEFS